MTDLDVAVVGGGISGLSAARELCRVGLRVRVFERESSCGGLIRTDRVGDFVIDPGPDTLLAHNPAALALCRELGLDACLVQPMVPRTTYVLRGGRLRALPETSVLGCPTDWKPLVATRAFSFRGKLRMAAEPFIPPALTRSDESIASFVGRRFGREALTYLAEPMLAGFHRGDAQRLSVHSLFPALVDAERKHGSVARAWRRDAAGQQRQRSMSLRSGLYQLVERLRAALPSGVVATGSEVSKVERGRPFVVRLIDGRAVSAAAVVLAAPAHVAAELVAALDRELAGLLGSIRSVSAVTVALGYPSGAVRHPLRGWGLVVPVPERRRLTAATWLSSKWPNRAPAEQVLIRASLGGSRDPAAIDEPDGVLIGWAAEDLRSIVGLSKEPIMARVYRWRRLIPQLEVGHGDRLSSIERCLARLPGLFISAGGVRGVGISDCIADAQTVARRTASYVQGRASWFSPGECAISI